MSRKRKRSDDKTEPSEKLDPSSDNGLANTESDRLKSVPCIGCNRRGAHYLALCTKQHLSPIHKTCKSSQRLACHECKSEIVSVSRSFSELVTEASKATHKRRRTRVENAEKRLLEFKKLPVNEQAERVLSDLGFDKVLELIGYDMEFYQEHLSFGFHDSWTEVRPGKEKLEREVKESLTDMRDKKHFSWLKCLEHLKIDFRDLISDRLYETEEDA